MKTKLFTGAATALVTPFYESGEINFDCLRDLIEFQIQNGISALVIAGTTGEASTLSFEEFSLLIAKSNEYIRHRVPLIAGTGSNNTATALKLSLEAEKRGANGLLIVTPYYNKTTQEGLRKHYLKIASCVKTPIILYNVPSRTGVKISPETCRRLEEHPNIIGIKEASGEIGYTIDIASQAPKLTIYSGNDDQILPILSLGGEGIISVASNIVPRNVQAICKHFQNGEIQKAIDLQLQLIPLIRTLFSQVNPIPIKRAVEMIGFPVGVPRLPLVPCDSKTEDAIARAIKEATI
ncbi:MAG: 4-hydroxy-tetrahydrodipicolinate synthase [Clostridia bacterium]|nr:4-hydroxy-tetrahydrodipicolinate synthase [Clostridia bacterium]